LTPPPEKGLNLSKLLVSDANIAGRLIGIVRPEKKIIHRSLAGIIVEDTEDYIKKK
jgi:hypothetical protein